MRRHVSLIALLALGAGACAPGASGGDEILEAEDACAIDCGGKADAFGISENSYEALGILEVANTLSFEALDDEVPLHRTAADNIVAHRPIESLEQLDGISWVGPVGFGRILEYAQANGYVGSCGDAELQEPIEDCDPGLDTSCSDTCRGGSSLDRDALSDDPRLSDREMVAGIRESSYLAAGVLRVANESSLDTLDYEVPLDVRAAKNIFYDRPSSGWPSLTALDEIPWVGPTAIERLADYALAQDMVPYCGDGMSYDLLEQCDDGNTDDGDWCTTGCEITSVCGDGVEEGPHESCDDGNTVDRDGCSSSCALETLAYDGEGTEVGTYRRLSHRISTNRSGTASVWVLDVAQGGSVGLDYSGGTSVGCYYSPHAGWDLEYYGAGRVNPRIAVHGPDGSEVAATYGTSSAIRFDVEPGRYEIYVGNDHGCGSGHRARPGSMPYTISLDVVGTGPVCGDGVKSDGEECDDGNRDGADGCSASCLVEHLAEAEPNDDRDHATAFGTYSVAEGTVDGAEQDWYSVRLDAAGDLAARLECTSDTVLELYDVSGERLQRNDDADGSRCSRVTASDLAAGHYYLRVTHYDDSLEGDYTLHLER